MEIISPATYVFDCKCHCGSHFIATDKDMHNKTLRLVEDFWSPNDVSGDNTYFLDMIVIECPFCGAFKIVNSDVMNNPKLYQEILEKNPKEVFMIDKKIYDQRDKALSELLDIEVKKWSDIPVLKRKYKDGLGLEALND